MIKKIASIFKKKGQPQAKLYLEKDAIDANNEQVLDEYFHRLPGFPQGIPVLPVELLIRKNEALIKQIVLARGMAGVHNKAEVVAKTMAPIRHLAEMTHLLPASEKNHYKLPGGLFAFCLEVSLFSIRYAERRILTRATPEIRKEYEALWAHAAFLTGLFSEAITALSKLSVYAEDVGIEWHPGTESLYEWLQRNNLKRYHIRWSEKEDRAMIYILAGKAIKTEQAEILAQGEKAIYKTLLAALHDQTDFNNPLAKINDQVKYKLMERDEWSYADRYGKPLAGMHLEPWLIDAMRHLVQKKRWFPNEENGRIWHGQDGVYLVWPLAAGDMQYQLKASECPFVPSTQEILAEIMLDAGIIESSNGVGGYLFDIEVPMAESGEKKHFEALKLARYEILFVKTQHKPIEGNLRVEQEVDEEDAVDNKTPGLAKNEQDQEKSPGNAHRRNKVMKSMVDESNSVSGETEQDLDFQSNGVAESVTESSQSNKEPEDMNILFGKRPVSLVETGKVQNNSREIECDPELDALFNGEPALSAVNQYDDDYAADYQPAEENEYQKYPSSIGGNNLDMLSTAKAPPQASGEMKSEQVSEKKEPSVIAEKPKKIQLTESSHVMEQQAQDPVEDLMGALISKSEPKSPTVKPQGSIKESLPEIDGLFGKAHKMRNGDQPGRAILILNRLKKLPAEFLAGRPDGITKVMALGLKNTKLELKDCVSVLKAADLLVLINGHETAVDSTGKGVSRYFLVKADLLNGK
jgi:hypothetical protein